MRAAGINPFEVYMRTGTYAIKPPLPYIPGSDGAGEVEAVGSGVTRVKVGDRVYTYAAGASLIGTYAESLVCAEKHVFPLGNKASFAQGAAIGVPYTTAYRALFNRGRAVPGETVLVHGATGGVGIAAVQLAHQRGLRVIGSGGSARSLSIGHNGATNDGYTMLGEKIFCFILVKVHAQTPVSLGRFAGAANKG